MKQIISSEIVDLPNNGSIISSEIVDLSDNNSMSSDEIIRKIIMNVKDVLLMYKKITDNSYNLNKYEIIRNGCNDDNIDIIMSISKFIMTRYIDGKYRDLANYRMNIDNPFIRAISNLLFVADFQNKNEEYKKLISLIDIYCIISRKKTFDEYIKYYRGDNISDEALRECFDNYEEMSYPDKINIDELFLVKFKVDPDLVYSYLEKLFDTKLITYTNNLSQSNLEKNFSNNNNQCNGCCEAKNSNNKFSKFSIFKKYNPNIKKYNIDIDNKNWRDI